MKNPIWKALLTIFIIVPASVVIATMLWNGILTQVVTWAYPINFWQMLGIMLLWYVMYPGVKPGLNQLDLVKQAGIRQQYVDQSASLNLAFVPSIKSKKGTKLPTWRVLAAISRTDNPFSTTHALVS